MSDKQILEDIRLARKFLRSHFDSMKTKTDDMLFSSGWAIKYPDVDRAVVTPTVFDKEMEAGSVSYRLTWTEDGLVWESEGLCLRRSLGLPNLVLSLKV